MTEETEQPPAESDQQGRARIKLWEALREQLRTADETEIRGSFAARQLLNEIDPLDDLKRTPVMIGYWWGNLAAANELVKMGAEYGAKDAQGHSVSWYAKNFGRGANALDLSRKANAEHLRISMNAEIGRVITDK